MKQQLRSISALAVAVGLVWAGVQATSANAAVDARLVGGLNMTVKTLRADSDRGSVGSVLKRHWSFKPLCGKGVCDRVRLTRALSSGSMTYTLKRVGKGVWAGKGFNRSASYGCDPRPLWKGAVDRMKVTVTGVYTSGPRSGNAKSIRADYVLKLSRFTRARAKTTCGRLYKKQMHLRVGARPVNSFKASGRFR